MTGVHTLPGVDVPGPRRSVEAGGETGGDRTAPEAPRYDWAQSARDLALLVALREARQRFIARLAARADNRAAFDRLIGTHRDVVLLIAEFFYALRAMNISTEEAVKAFIDRHNRHIQARLDTEFKRTDGAYVSGGLAERLRQSTFGPGAVRMIEITLAEQRRLKLSQSDVARFLVEVMSDETSRKVLSGLCEAGLLTREREPVNHAIVVWSEKGALESAFGQHLAEIRGIAASLA